jgi:glycosyltransferase involved in cell wall biosynthesis
MGTIHLIGLPHTQFDANTYSSCAFTAKAVRTVQMWRNIGRDTTVYWAGDQADVTVISNDELVTFFGPYNPSRLPAVEWDPNLGYWQLFHERAINEIRARWQPGDWIAVVGGAISQPVIDAFPNTIRLEPGVGYEGLARDTFACFESYAWMHNRYGALGIGNGRFYDMVIPNAVDPDEWVIGQSDGYLLFVGRMIARKGPHVAAQIAERAGRRILFAGAGVTQVKRGLIRCQDGTLIEGDHCEYLGSVTGDDRRDLFSHADVLLMPTLYVEPWGGVHAEALMSGVPVVAPDFGVFTETLPFHRRFRTLGEAVAITNAASSVRDRTAEELRKKAIDQFGIDNCAAMYDEWFWRIDGLAHGGWYA